MQPVKQTTLILGRHGQTISNRDGFVLGRSDSPLTPQGIRTAETMARYLETRRVERIFSSPLGRAAATSRIYANRLELPVDLRDSMAELSCGSWEGRLRSEVAVDHRFLRPTWHTRPPGGESYADGELRMAPFIEELRSLGAVHGNEISRSGKTRPLLEDDVPQAEPSGAGGLSSYRRAAQEREFATLVVGHASINRVFLKLWLNVDPELALKISCPHDTVYTLGTDSKVAAWNSDGSVADELFLEQV